MKPDTQIDHAQPPSAARLLNARMIARVPGLFSEGYEAPSAPKSAATRLRPFAFVSHTLGKLTQCVVASLREALFIFAPAQAFEVEAVRQRVDR